MISGTPTLQVLRQAKDLLVITKFLVDIFFIHNYQLHEITSTQTLISESISLNKIDFTSNWSTPNV